MHARIRLQRAAGNRALGRQLQRKVSIAGVAQTEHGLRALLSQDGVVPKNSRPWRALWPIARLWRAEGDHDEPAIGGLRTRLVEAYAARVVEGGSDRSPR